jgi:hypothetical protein
VLHAKVQPVVKLQPAVPFGAVGQLLPHAWQFITVCKLVSHPSPSVLLQSSKRAAQDWIRHVPVVHVGVAFARLHGAPHAPQSVVLLSCVSQPLLSLLSQLS